jgi:predicted amidohydrolase YtcJ
VVFLDGKTLLPGFIDCHLHPVEKVFFLLHPDLSEVKNVDELTEILRRASVDKGVDDLILGFNFCEEIFDPPTLPTRWDLDKASSDKPIFIVRYDGHIGVANSRALEVAGIDENTKPPDGGEIRKNDRGELTGVISEKARDLILSKISLPNAEEINVAAEKTFRLFASKGLTSLQGVLSADKSGEFGDTGAFELPIFKTIQDKILQNFYILLNTGKPEKLTSLKNPPLHDLKMDGKFKLGCLKLYFDGTLGAKTALMSEPFSDAPNMRGFCVISEKEIYERMKAAHINGFQIGIHTIGDKANKIVINLYKKLLNEYPRENHRHRIEHASILTKDVIEDMKEYGVIASCQPPFINSEHTWLEKRLGKERCKYTYPFKSIIEAGIVLVSGSDCPIEDSSPILGLHALVTRNGFIPEECISIEEALKTYTIKAAYSCFEENIKGSIEVGKLADLVILDKNPLEIPSDQIKNLQVLETIIRGKSVYKRS